MNFKLENWMSFRDEATISMLASDGLVADHKLPYVKEHDLEVLPVCAIYGGNSAGKTNLFRAFQFLKSYITANTPGDRRIPVEHFLLDSKPESNVTKFHISILSNGNVYNFSFAVTPSQVVSEKLEIMENGKPTTIYTRTRASKGEKIKLFQELNRPEVEYAAKLTGESNLILTNQVLAQEKGLSDVFNWFDESLFLFSPRSKFNVVPASGDGNGRVFDVMSFLLRLSGSNIDGIEAEDIDFRKMNIPDSMKMDISNSMSIKARSHSFCTFGDVACFLEPKEDRIVAKRMSTRHLDSSGEAVKFDLEKESDGTRKFISLIPAFSALNDKKSDVVVFIDDMDSGMHANLTRSIIEVFLQGSRRAGRSQLLFTTHDTDLIDKRLLRADEILLVDQASSGASFIRSVDDFEESLADGDLKRSYLDGRFGGVSNVYLSSPDQFT